MQKNIYHYIIAGLFIFIIDRVSKYAALMFFTYPFSIIGSFLTAELHFNRGVSWGLFHASSNAVFLCVSSLIVIFTALLCLDALYQYRNGNSIFGHVCVIVGSLSNIIDRALYGGVIDFIVVSYHDFHWPVFNCADVAIVLGVGIMFLNYEFRQR